MTEQSIIRRLTDEDFESMFNQQARAYPTFFQAEGEKLERIRTSMRQSMSKPGITWFGFFDNDRLAGSMRLHDYRVHYRGAEVRSGGVGSVAVDLPDKKKRIAKRMMEFYIDHYIHEGAPLGLLWPFRHDFYRQMGFGYGGTTYRYSIPPASLPDSTLRKHVRLLDPADTSALADCYHRYARTVSGMVLEPDDACPKFISDALSAGRVIGYEQEGRLDGFLIYQFGEKQKVSPFVYDMAVTRFVATTPSSLAGFCGFLRAQADQVRHLTIDLTDADFPSLLLDPRDTSRELFTPVVHMTGRMGVGIMYRVLDIARLIESTAEARYGTTQVTVGFTIDDSFRPANSGRYTIAFSGGRARLVEAAREDIAVTLNIADFSSLVMGSISLSKLIMYDRVQVSEPNRVQEIDRLFAVTHPSTCVHPF